jgi:hypothetical protein
MTKNTVYLVSGGTNYYLSNAGDAYNGSGTPWTAENTTPYELSLNSSTPIWAPGPAPAAVIYGGGPPFRWGSNPLYRGYDNIVEQVGIQMRATSKDNAIKLLNQLRLILNTALYSVPCMLAVQGGTNTAFFEIYSADVPELPTYLSEGGANTVLFRAPITWIRSPFAGVSGLTTLINNVALDNTGTGSPDNVESYGTLTGDLVQEGQPLNITIPYVANEFDPRIVYLASVYSRTYNAPSAAKTTTSTTGVNFSASPSSQTVYVGDATNRLGLRIRLLSRFTTFTNPDKIRVCMKASTFGGPSLANEFILYQSPWITLGAGSSARFLDFGGFSPDALRLRVGASGIENVMFNAMIASTDGTSVTATWSYRETLLYYTFCRVKTLGLMTTNEYFAITGAQKLNGSAYLPREPAIAYLSDSNGNYNSGVHELRGTPPRAFTGASLYLAWTDDTYVHDTADTANVTVQMAPLYRTLRGGA